MVIHSLSRAHEEIDRAISAALHNSKPVYICVACNLAGGWVGGWVGWVDVVGALRAVGGRAGGRAGGGVGGRAGAWRAVGGFVHVRGSASNGEHDTLTQLNWIRIIHPPCPASCHAP